MNTALPNETTVNTRCGWSILKGSQYLVAISLREAKHGGNDMARVTTSTRTIAVIMPNSQDIRTADWRSYRVSVDQIEQLTGYDFFSNVPVSIQGVSEARVDNQ
jgi:endonuclease G